MTPSRAGKHPGSWFVTIPVAVLSLAYIWFGFLPGRKAIAELHEQIKAKHQLLEQSHTQNQAALAVQQSLLETQAYAQKWSKLAPNVQNTAALCGSIHQLAADAKLTTTRFDPQVPVKRDSFTQVPISIQAIGSFAGVYSFLTRLEGLPLRIWIESFNMTSAEKNGKSGGNIVADIKLVVFTNNPKDSDYVNPTDHPIN